MLIYLIIIDIDECVESAVKGISLCNESMMCVNILGTYQCQCPPGAVFAEDIQQCIASIIDSLVF